jgi:hypothetical protein
MTLERGTWRFRYRFSARAESEGADAVRFVAYDESGARADSVVELSDVVESLYRSSAAPELDRAAGRFLALSPGPRIGG